MRLSAIALLLLACACSQPKKNDLPAPAFDENKEKVAIMQVIEKETDCFYKRDYNCWKECFAQTDYVFQAWNNSDGTVDAKSGWKEVDEKIGQYIKNNPVPAGESSMHPVVQRRNMVIHFFNDSLVTLMWNQYNINEAKHNYTFSKDTRIMEKITGQWKIVNVSSYWDYKNLVPEDSLK
jgi:hypothetical protein